ncbi:hypothetical protein COCHEDRAFT_1192284 [Bipolaris maydis C5]|uniref:DUF7918 domain-containing protein n=1 Tax=Cochliobolus heterostrophus (strain C5 / ATCC 48332 / race O) TaxID=701091 RepID=M2U6J5_COCH5|nr:hypothetical protein COCHEDRAFT_1192284 [Bipolaris maydis C5]
MPSLKDLNCSIELSQTQHALPEYGTTYGDGFVETFVPVPNQPQSFSIHLTSNTLIAPGIAIFVYVDGVYQCNRNRQDIKPRKPSDSRSLVDFRVRQKEERQKDGSMIAREWTFDNLDIGCIEVVVLRCAGSRDAKSASAINLDGAGDWPDHRFSLKDSTSSHNRSMYDDRGPFFNSSRNISGPPAPWSSYRAPYAETLQSLESSKTQIQHNTLPVRHKSSRVSVRRQSKSGSRYSEVVSPRTRRLESLPSSGFQYGSGPIPPDRKLARRDTNKVTTPETSGVNPAWLETVLKAAVKQGVEESRQAEAQSARRHHPNAISAVTAHQIGFSHKVGGASLRQGAKREPTQIRAKSICGRQKPPTPYAPSAKGYAWDAIGAGEKDRNSTASSTWGSNRVHSWAIATSPGSTWETEKPKNYDKTDWYSTSDDDDGNIKWTTPPADRKNPEPIGWQDIIKPTSPSDTKKSKSKSKPTKKDSLALQELKSVLEMSLGKEKKGDRVKGNNESQPAIQEEKDQKDKKNKSSGRNPTSHRDKSSKSPTRSRVQPPKPHWCFPPPPPPASLLPSPSQSAITAAAGSKKRPKHVVRTSTPIPYGHAIARPEYVDSLEKPYAVFRFKYRSLDALKKLGVIM